MTKDLPDGFAKSRQSSMTVVIGCESWPDDTTAFAGMMRSVMCGGGESIQSAIDAVAACKPVKTDNPKSYAERWEEATAGSVTPTVMFGFDYDKKGNRLQQLANQFAAICPSADLEGVKKNLSGVT